MKNKVLKARVRWSGDLLNNGIEGYILEIWDDDRQEWDLSFACRINEYGDVSSDFVEEIRRCIALGYEIVV